MEDGSVLSMESNEDPREIYELAGEGQHDHLGEDYTDYDGFEGSLSMSDDESERLIHPHDNPLHIYPHAHHGNIAHLPVPAQLWTQVNQHAHLDQDPLEERVLSRVNSLNSVLDSVAVSHWPYTCFIGAVQ